MRLVRPCDDDHGPALPPQVPALAITVREPQSGRVLAEFLLRLTTAADPMVSMRPLSSGTSGADTDALSIRPVAGRIDPAGTDLGRAIDAWLSYLRARGRKQRSIDAFRQVVRRAARDRGWSTAADLTFEGVTTWLGEQPWKGTTYNRNLSAFRSLTRYLVNAKRIAEDPLAVAERAEDDGGDGARAATLQEARKIILRAWVRDQADRRCKGNRALYWLCLFSGACRLGEPAGWRRRHLILDHDPPHVLWTPELHKNRKRQEVALTPELAGLIREHLRGINRERAAGGLPPAGPDDPVFPTVPSKGTFTKDRDAAGIAAQDYRGRAFSPHSARKFFSTVLTGLGVPEKMVDRLMRHAGRVEHRYYDPPLAEQAAAVARLPGLWPEPGRPGGSGEPVDNRPDGSGGSDDLTNRGRIAEDGRGTLLEAPPEEANSSTPPGSASPQAKCQRAERPGPVGVTEFLRTAGRGCPGSGGAVETCPGMRPEIGISGLITGTDSNDLADFLAALARLLRSRSSGHEGRSRRSRTGP